MQYIPDSKLDRFINDRALISISRENLDSRKLQGFPIKYSADLLLLRYVYDFHLDGLLLIRRTDITEMLCRETDRFQRRLLETENRIDKSLFKTSHSVDSISQFLAGINPANIAIVEDERPEQGEFYIGKVVSAKQERIDILEFSGAGNWHGSITEIDVGGITCCQTETNYIKFYERHFRRTSTV